MLAISERQCIYLVYTHLNSSLVPGNAKEGREGGRGGRDGGREGRKEGTQTILFITKLFANQTDKINTSSFYF